MTQNSINDNDSLVIFWDTLPERHVTPGNPDCTWTQEDEDRGYVEVQHPDYVIHYEDDQEYNIASGLAVILAIFLILMLVVWIITKYKVIFSIMH